MKLRIRALGLDDIYFEMCGREVVHGFGYEYLRDVPAKHGEALVDTINRWKPRSDGDESF